jgi:hypothetical protein
VTVSGRGVVVAIVLVIGIAVSIAAFMLFRK